MALRWRILLVPVFITAGMAFAVNWAGSSPDADAPRETPPITLSDLDGDGDLDMLVESPAPLGQVNGGALGTHPLVCQLQGAYDAELALHAAAGD